MLLLWFHFHPGKEKSQVKLGTPNKKRGEQSEKSDQFFFGGCCVFLGRVFV